MKRIITYGTFDLLHIGHLRLLQRAKALGDYLIVGVSSDAFNRKKGKKSYYTEQERMILLKQLRCVDEVILESSWDQKEKDINELWIDCLVMGDDWAGKFDELKEYCEVIYLPRTQGISTTKIKQDLSHISL